jgi:hypothetical protein
VRDFKTGNVELTNDFAVPGPVHGVMRSTVNRERREEFLVTIARMGLARGLAVNG